MAVLHKAAPLQSSVQQQMAHTLLASLQLESLPLFCASPPYVIALLCHETFIQAPPCAIGGNPRRWGLPADRP